MYVYMYVHTYTYVDMYIRAIGIAKISQYLVRISKYLYHNKSTYRLNKEI